MARRKTITGYQDRTGSGNDKGMNLSGAIRSERMEIRCTPAFKEVVQTIAAKEHKSAADILHQCLKYYVLGRVWWADKKLLDKAQNEI